MKVRGKAQSTRMALAILHRGHEILNG
jgi:hypothetical protein